MDRISRLLAKYLIKRLLLSWVLSVCVTLACGILPWGVEIDTLKSLGFTYQQIEDLQVIHSILIKEKAELRSQVEKKEQRLEELLSNPETPRDTLLEIEKQISELRNKILETDVNAMLKVKETLSPEQYKKFRGLIWKEGAPGAPCKNR